MARKKTTIISRPTAPDTRKLRMFPSFHQDVVDAVFTELPTVWFCANRGETHIKYKTHVMGRFTCVNDACFADGWTSKKVAILIRSYTGNGYNADVFNQCCKVCGQRGHLFIDKASYIDRVVYRIRKWAGVAVERPHYSSQRGQPHRHDLCEGCKMGVCQQDND